MVGVSDTDFKLIDFGLADDIDSQNNAPHSFQGSRMYAAPEVGRKEHNGKENDMWAIGMIAFVLLWGCFPFSPKSRYWDVGFTFTFPIRKIEVSSDARDFYTRLLQMNAADRMTVDEALEHPWINAEAEILEQNSLHEGLQRLIKRYGPPSNFFGRIVLEENYSERYARDIIQALLKQIHSLHRRNELHRYEVFSEVF